MNTSQLNYLKVIAEVGTIQKASALLDKNPSTLTRIVKSAEKEYHAPVFERVEKRLIPTPEGEVILRYIHDVLAGLAKVNQMLGKEIEWNDNDIRYLMEIRREGNISSAAEKMFIAQPSLSQKLMSLEEEVGFQIFYRGKFGVSETKQGTMLLDNFVEIQERDHRLRRDLDEFQRMREGKTKNKVSLGVLPQMGACLLPVVLPVFRKEYPGVQVKFAEQDESDLLRMVKNKRLNFCIFTTLSQEEKSVSEEMLKTEYCTEDRMYLIVPKGMREMFTFKSGQTLGKKELRQLSGIPFIMNSNSIELREMTTRILEECHSNVDVQFSTKHMETARRLASAGVGVTMMPLTCLGFRSEEENTDYYPISDELGASWELRTAYRSDYELTLEDREFIRLLKEGMKEIK